MRVTGKLALFLLLGSLMPLTCQAASDEQKDFAFSVVERKPPRLLRSSSTSPRVAALMTGTTTEYQLVAAGWPQLGVKTIAEAVQGNIDKVGMPRWSEDEQRFAREFQKSAGRKEVGLITTVTPLGGRPQACSSNDNGRRFVGGAGRPIGVSG